MALLQKTAWGCEEEHRNTWYLQAKNLHIVSCILLHLHSQPTQSIKARFSLILFHQLREKSRKQSLFLTWRKNGTCAVHLSDLQLPMSTSCIHCDYAVFCCEAAGTSAATCTTGSFPATRNCTQASDGSLCCPKGNCTEIYLSSKILCNCLLCSGNPSVQFSQRKSS